MNQPVFNHILSRKTRFYSALLILLFNVSADASFGYGYDYTPALVHVGRNNQPDSVGFNVVKELTALVYRKVLDEELTLWDSPEKKIKIGKVALELIEQKNGIRFVDNEDLFLYEYWKLYKKKFEFQIFGISFFRRLENGSKLNLGYVDCEEAKEMLSSLVIPTNANGQANLSYWSALMSKSYPFDLVKFGNKDLSSNPTESFNIVERSLKHPKVKTNAFKVEDVKKIEYNILPTLDNRSGNFWLIRALNNYFDENRHEYFNLTKNPAISHLDIRTPLKVTRIEVQEIWERDENMSLQYHPLRIRLYINNVAMEWMPSSEMEQFGLIVQFKPLMEFIKEKEFNFTIQKINDERIYGLDQDDLLTSLRAKAWNKITYSSKN